MANSPFIGEIRAVGFNFAPKNWAMCNGQLLAISQNQALFSILGTTYGGNGQTTFALPDLRGRTPIHFGSDPQAVTYTLGEKTGGETETLSLNEMPAHTHLVKANATANIETASNNFPAGPPSGNNVYGPPAGATMDPALVPNAGGSQPHANLQPYLTLNYIICLVGIFPSRN